MEKMECCGKDDEPKIKITNSTSIEHNHGEEEEEEEEEEHHCSYALQLANMSVIPMVMKAAVDLNLLEIIAKSGPGAKLSPAEIAGQMPTRNPEAPAMVDRILRLLASHSVVTCSIYDGDGHSRVYGLTPVAKYFVRNEEGASFGPLLALTQDKVFMESWYALKDAVLEGGVAFDKVHGTHAFDYPGKDPRFNEVFNNAMTNHTTIFIKKILHSYKGFDNDRLKLLVDVGGGLGVNLNIIVSKYPNIKGINFDLPHVIQHAPSYPGVEHVGGDMFVNVPKADAIFMKWILHDWSDDHCLKLLKNCYKALPDDDGKVIVVEAILPVIPNTSADVKTACQSDLVMMTQNPGGKERTQQEFLDLATRAGFSGIRLECFACNFWVIEFYK